LQGTGGVFVLRAITPLYVIAILVLILQAGCSNEASKKTETGQETNVVQVASGKAGAVQSGEELFKQYCSSCHPDGANVSDPSISLYGSALRRNYITKPEDIVRIMRNPLSRMIRFDVSTLSDKDAMAIAEYILATFK
jgi:cytochrome c6